MNQKSPPSDAIIFKPFDKQKLFLRSTKRTKGAFAGKRGGKTEAGAVQAIIYQENKLNYKPNGIDPYLGLIIAPTHDMMRGLSLKKFLAYAQPFIGDHNIARSEVTWHDGSEILGLSGDKPKRIEGRKAGWIWLDEVFQMSEDLFLECKARVADTEGYLICTGSLGVQYVNPKLHWAYKYFKERPDDETECIEWATADNPYFPRSELERLKNTLDPETYRQMFDLSWDTIPKNAVYSNWDSRNEIESYTFNTERETYVAIDWGWAHPMAIGFFQYDRKTDTVYMFDEIVASQMTLDQAYDRIMSKGYPITDWACDIAGNQEREQTGMSNIKWFRSQKNIHFRFRTDSVQNGVSLVRSYIQSANGTRRFYISKNCRKTLDCVKQYRYVEKDGVILNENPLKKDDDPVDMVRYFFINFLKPNRSSSKSTQEIYR